MIRAVRLFVAAGPLVFGGILCCVAQMQSPSLVSAVRQGEVHVHFEGTGASSGDAVKVWVAKTSKARPGTLRLAVPAGLELRSRDACCGSMVVARVAGRAVSDVSYVPSSVLIVGNDPALYILNAYDTAFYSDNPSSNTEFELGRINDMLACIVRQGYRANASVASIQAAVWIYTDKVRYEQVVEKFAVTQSEWDSAQRLFTGCTNNPGTGPQQSTLGEQPPDEQSAEDDQWQRNLAIENQFTRSLDEVNTRFATEKKAIPIVRDELLAAHGFYKDPEVSGYRLADISTFSITFKKRLISAADAPELAGIRDYINRAYPSTPEATFVGKKYGRMISIELAQKFFSEIANLMSSLMTVAPRIIVTLEVHTTPAGARVQLFTFDGTLIRETTSNSRFTNLFRGLYNYRVEKDNFKTIVNGAPLNLVDEDGTILDCALVGHQNRQAPLPCSLR